MSNPTHELALERPLSGWLGLAVVLALVVGGAALVTALRPTGVAVGAAAILLGFFWVTVLLSESGAQPVIQMARTDA